jgi:hypothetical protein
MNKLIHIEVVGNCSFKIDGLKFDEYNQKGFYSPFLKIVDNLIKTTVKEFKLEVSNDLTDYDCYFIRGTLLNPSASSYDYPGMYYYHLFDKDENFLTSFNVDRDFFDPVDVNDKIYTKVLYNS